MIRTVSIRDLVARQFFRGELNRYDIFVRYLAIEEYYGKNDFGFRLYKKMQDKRIAEGYGEKAVEKFIELIKSYEIRGYDKSSAVQVGCNLALWDGSHRIAMGLYNNLQNITIEIHQEPTFYDFKIDWFLKNDFSREEVKLIIDKADEVLEKNQIKFTGFLWGAAVPFSDEIFKDIEIFGEVKDIEKFSFKSRELYNHMQKIIYSADDIAPVKVDIKSEFLYPYDPEFIFFHFKPKKFYDHWRVKGMSGLPMSCAVERVKSVVREKYKNKIDKYFHDIIIHVCDNQFQSDFCDSVCFPDINLKTFLQEISPYKYVLLGMRGNETPYMPENFPDEIPVGKDVDILVMPEDYDLITETAKKFSEQYKNNYEIILIDEKYKTRIRFHKSERLILQLDIAKELKNCTDEFVTDSIKMREKSSDYYVLSAFYEYICRYQKWMENSKKSWHLKYLLNHAKDFDEKLAEKYGNFKDCLKIE
ncbi:MAG: hypothetical protein IK062_06200 [Selenomonadaceae bacterium]|nr:hypothetical protein [Selenomonadaceae bacterium]